MEVTKNTTVGDVLPFLKPEHIEELLKSPKISEIPYGKPILGMTIGEFFKCMEDNYLQQFFNNLDEPLAVAVGKYKWFKHQMENINKVLNLNEIKLSNEEKTAQKGVVFPSFQENVLCECIEWFHLHSMDEAEALPLSNYLIYKRKKSAEALFDRNLNNLYAAKQKKQNTKR